ncbi:WcaI family glycosyltransferase, partial [Mesonia sp.]|uniref:WcaI family glycosyltransferase n=1 Tax=Mesonia sp. TaxID=1960830 RepID=UPI0017685E4C
MKIKNITLISLNFYPENTAIGLYSTQFAEYLNDNGYNVSVITAFPYYPQWRISENYKSKPKFLKENYKGISIYRYKQYTPSNPTFLKRIVHILDFTIGSYFNTKKTQDCDLVISVIPFTTSALLGNFLSKKHKSKSWIHIQDFEFDAAFQSGLAFNKKGSFLYKLLMKFERNVLNKADKVSTISYSMIKKLQSKTASTTYFFPNWIDSQTIDPKKAKQHPLTASKKFKILYSGSIADKQNWNLFLEIVENINSQEYEFILVGDGSAKVNLEEELKAFNIKIHPPVSYETLNDLLCGTDLHFLFQKEEILDTVMPSKILGMMASAKPSIVTGHKDSEVHKVLRDSNGGVYLTRATANTVIKEIEKAKQHPLTASKKFKILYS